MEFLPRDRLSTPHTKVSEAKLKFSTTESLFGNPGRLGYALIGLIPPEVEIITG